MVQILERGRRAGELIEEAGSMTWTDNRLVELKRLWGEEALTSTQIAARMWITRGTVLGKINSQAAWRSTGWARTA